MRIAFLVIATALAVSRAPFAHRPPLAHTGGFGEPSCAPCHFTNAVNDPAGSLRLDGLPSSYLPGMTYSLAFALAKPGLERGGFELTARWAEGPKAGRQAGLLEPLDSRTDVTDTVLARYGTVRYARHTRDGNSPAAPGTIGWTLKWTAPADLAGAVVFTVAANAANGDDSPLDDFIYTASTSARPSR